MLWSHILDKYGSKYTSYLAQRCEHRARQNILSSTNWDGSKMVTRKKVGKPLIDTGYMVSAINSIGNKCISPAPYTGEVQRYTGNIFIQKPTPEDIQEWTIDYIKKT